MIFSHTGIPASASPAEGIGVFFVFVPFILLGLMALIVNGIAALFKRITSKTK